jgi:hypothetical protein
MAKRVWSMSSLKVVAASEKRCVGSPAARSGKSWGGNACSEKRERPEKTESRPSSGPCSICTCAPSGSLRTMSCIMWAGTVVAPSWATSAGAVSTTSMSRSVAVSRIEPASAWISTLARIGMVLRRSTTLWTWVSDFSSAARSMMTRMPFPHHAAGAAGRGLWPGNRTLASA